MKTSIVFILFVMLSVSSFSQNRKGLLKEIHEFENKTYKSTLYRVTTAEMKLALYAYFNPNNYQIYEEDSSSVTFVRTSDLSIFKGYIKMVRHYVLVDIVTKNKLKTISISDKTESYAEPFRGVEKKDVRGAYRFDKKELYNYIYHYFKKEKLILTDELIFKIDTFNSKQKNENKKLIAGRDY